MPVLQLYAAHPLLDIMRRALLCVTALFVSQSVFGVPASQTTSGPPVGTSSDAMVVGEATGTGYLLGLGSGGSKGASVSCHSPQLVVSHDDADGSFTYFADWSTASDSVLLIGTDTVSSFRNHMDYGRSETVTRGSTGDLNPLSR
ncbi:hypothetical protein EW146_g8800 [Bondarzewia mesenterica]|uniref:Uncharacterized protein n=1 Tax=Bondarzewia mesenterica TaxID=1095465 RepID=A0A4S4LBH0_9AGAM|nr:hypothetical protein EW146_g8800 [Bondarzewia mesenterica]